jgi:RNA polymerase sigma-70 factor (ECF subfamily)
LKFRHEHGRLVAMLVRRVGVRHIELVEDAVQAAMLAAVETWPRAGKPDNESAWLHRAASNHLIGELRSRARRDRLLERNTAPEEHVDAELPGLGGDVSDDMLRMLFACCEPSMPAESQLVLALKTLSGFSTAEIAARLFTTEANVYKRLARARALLRELPFAPDELEQELSARLAGVQSIGYVMFSEGHLSSHAEHAIRRELCDEAIRLVTLLAEHRVTATPETFALLALMHLHAARLSARHGSGGLVLFEEQDRSLWDAREIELGLAWLARSASGDVLSRYHVEAGIAAEHCLAPSFAETRWDRIAESYALLDRIAPSPLAKLNRAIALAEARGPDAGLAALDGLEPPSWLAGSYLWSAVLADLHGRSGHLEAARRHRDVALATAPSPAIRDLLARRLDYTSASGG